MAGVMVPGDSGRWEKVEIGWYVHDSGAVIQKWWKGYGSPGGMAGWYAWRHGVADDEWIGPFATAKEAAHISDEERLASLLDRREELLPARQELDSVEAELKQILGERETVVCGDWLIQGTWVDRKASTVPAGRYLRRTYKRMGGTP